MYKEKNTKGNGMHRGLLTRSQAILLILMLFLTSCGGATSAKNSPAAMSTTIISSTATQQDLPPAYNFSKSQTVAGLFFNLTGFICASPSQNKSGPLSNLIIATKGLSYDTGTAQIIQNYLQLLSEHDTELNTWIPPQPPPELQWIPGNITCTGDMSITNTTNSSIELQNVGIQLTAAPAINAYDYRVIEIPSTCPGQCGGGQNCGYQASITLNDGGAGSNFTSSITVTGEQCPLPLIIPASGSDEVSITLQDAQARNMIYTGTPIFDITTSSGQQTIALSSLTSHFYFTHTALVPTYHLQGNSFVPYPTP